MKPRTHIKPLFLAEMHELSSEKREAQYGGLI
jgi:hypothetical protein